MNKQYQLLIKQLEALLEGEDDFIASLANTSALLFSQLERVNWLGFYLLDQDKSELVLGPFQGMPACTRISLGSGVCGTAYANGKTLRVDDVHQFEGHIACDAASESEVVVPFKCSVGAGVLDVDSPIKGRFSSAEVLLFESVVDIIQAKYPAA